VVCGAQGFLGNFKGPSLNEESPCKVQVVAWSFWKRGQHERTGKL